MKKTLGIHSENPKLGIYVCNVMMDDLHHEKSIVCEQKFFSLLKKVYQIKSSQKYHKYLSHTVKIMLQSKQFSVLFLINTSKRHLSFFR